MSKHPVVEQLIEAHLVFLEQEFAQAETVQVELKQFYHWLCLQPLQHIWSFDVIYQLIEKQILNTPASSFLIEQIAEHISLALQHPLNDQTKIEDVISVNTIDSIAQYVASKTEHRQRLIKTVVNNPAFSALITQLIQHSIQDYLDNSMMSKRVPGVGHLMKMGKSVLESVTDSNLNETIAHYLKKNVLKISQMSERVLNQHFDDDKLYHFQANIWHKVKLMPVSILRQYVEIQDLPKTVNFGHDIWDHIHQTPYLKQQVHDGVLAWYERNQARTFEQLLRDLNIDANLIENELSQLLVPILQKVIKTGYLKQRTRIYLEKFYYSEKVTQLLNP